MFYANDTDIIKVCQKTYLNKSIVLENKTHLLKIDNTGQLKFKKKCLCITEVWQITDKQNYINNISQFLDIDKDNNLLQVLP